MARSNLLALVLVLAACDVVPPGPVARPTLRATVTPYEEVTALYPDTARAFLDAINGGTFDAAYALIDEHFAFGGDCDYVQRSIWSFENRSQARNWLQVRMADHERIEVSRIVDAGPSEHAIGLDIVRSSDSIRAAGYAGGIVRPRVPLIIRFSLDGQRITGFAFAWSRPLAGFSDCFG